MASTLERLDAIRDQLINQGLGASGLTRQAIQRANLPQLGQELATSQATRAAEQRNRLSQFASRVASQRPVISGGGRGGAGDRSPLGVIERGLKGQGFIIKAPEGSGGGLQQRRFDTKEELESFLRSNRDLASRLVTGGQSILEGALDSAKGFGAKEALSGNLIDRLNRLYGVSLVTREDARQALGRSARPTSSPFKFAFKAGPSKSIPAFGGVQSEGVIGDPTRNALGVNTITLSDGRKGVRK